MNEAIKCMISFDILTNSLQNAMVLMDFRLYCLIQSFHSRRNLILVLVRWTKSWNC